MEEAKILLEIIKCFIYDKECATSNSIDESKLYKLAKINSVSNFLQNWAKKYCKSEEIKKEIFKDYSAQIVKDTNQSLELEKILDVFEKNNIKTLIVKGVIMKDIYPQNYMRQMCDIDILVQSENFKKASKLMKDLGFSKYYNLEKHLIFNKAPFYIVEMHRKLILKRDIGYEYFNDIWPLCINYKKYKNIYQLSIENAYIFCILHLLLHFKFTGVKIKDILDVYLYNEKYKEIMDYSKLDEKFKELDIKEFEENIKNIAYKWFGTDEINDFDDIEKFILKGTSSNNRVNYSIGNSKGKGDTVKKLLFPELEIMEEKYPVLKKAPALLPVMWGTRIFKDIFSKAHSLKSRINTVKLIQEADDEEVEKVKKIYSKLGIK